MDYNHQLRHRAPIQRGGGTRSRQSGSSIGDPLTQEPVLCHFFLSNRCRFGDSCRFSHKIPQSTLNLDQPTFNYSSNFFGPRFPLPPASPFYPLYQKSAEPHSDSQVHPGAHKHPSPALGFPVRLSNGYKISVPDSKPKTVRGENSQPKLSLDIEDSSYKLALKQELEALQCFDEPNLTVEDEHVEAPEIESDVSSDLDNSFDLNESDLLQLDSKAFTLKWPKNQRKEICDILSGHMPGHFSITNVYASHGPEILLDSKELSEGFSKMLPSIHSGWRGVPDGPFAGCSRTSQIAEALSYELFHRMYGASLLFTEMEIAYRSVIGVPKIDYMCSFSNKKFGVSVTRAANVKDQERGGKITSKEATHLLHKKLHGLLRAKAAVSTDHDWDLSVLHVWSATFSGTRRLQRVYNKITATWAPEERPLLVITSAEFKCNVAYSYIFGKE